MRWRAPRFVDRARLFARAGDGGRGCASFFRDTRVNAGPPDGGNGGRGGDVTIRACSSVHDLRFSSHEAVAGAGAHGSSDNQVGRRGDCVEVRVPCGTTVHRLGPVSFARSARMLAEGEAESTLIADLVTDGSSCVVARGGPAGRGNVSLRSGRLQSARMSEEGGAGETATLLLSLKLVADVGLVGFPNAGKSSLLSAISRAEPAVAAYEFTTLHPVLGVVDGGADHAPFTVADLPGLIEGAHADRGLGHEFLRHVERTSLLCFVLDLGAAQHPVDQFDALRTELELYLPGLSLRPSIIAANKADIANGADGGAGAEDADGGVAARLRALRAHVAAKHTAGELPGLCEPEAGGSRVTAISAARDRNLGRLVQRMRGGLAQAAARAAAADGADARLFQQKRQTAADEAAWGAGAPSPGRRGRRRGESGGAWPRVPLGRGGAPVAWEPTQTGGTPSDGGAPPVTH